MASQNPLFRPGGFTADADLSSDQYKFVKITGNYQVGLCDSAGERPYGVLQNKPNASGAAATIERSGISKVVAGETIVANDLVGTDANGKAVKVEATATGADLGVWAVGVAIEGGSADTVIAVQLGVDHLVTA